MKMIKDICSSCPVKNDNQCTIKNTGRNKDCPCTKCLLKSICVVTCPEWELLLMDQVKVKNE